MKFVIYFVTIGGLYFPNIGLYYSHTSHGDKSMTYSIRRQQDTITTQYGVYWGDTLVEGGFSGRADAWDAIDWLREHHPEGPEKVREVNGWWF